MSSSWKPDRICKVMHSTHHMRSNGKKPCADQPLRHKGGVWYWNSYPGARVDSEYNVYALDIQEVYNTWTWTEAFPVRTRPDPRSCPVCITDVCFVAHVDRVTKRSRDTSRTLTRHSV